MFDSCCLPGMTVDAHIKHEVNFSFSFAKARRRWLTFFSLTSMLLISCIFSQLWKKKWLQQLMWTNHQCEAQSKFKLLKGFLRSTSITATLLCFTNAGRVTTIWSHPYLSPSFHVLAHWHFLWNTFFSVQRSLVYRFFSRMCVCEVELGLLVVRVGVQAV